MKLGRSLSLLACVCSFALSACDFEKRCYCLETGNDLDYVQDMCYQANRSDIVEQVYLYNLPINPEADPKEYKYDISWKKDQRVDYFSFTGGLTGKRVLMVFRISDTILKVSFDSALANNEATSGYLKVNPAAFKGLTERATDAFLYAYIAIGDTSGLVNKPSDEQK